VKDLGNKGAYRRPADRVQQRAPSSAAEAAHSPSASPQPPTQTDEEYDTLLAAAKTAHMTSTRIGYLAAVEKFKEAAAVADHIGGAQGASLRANKDFLQTSSLIPLGAMAAAARAASSSLRSARAAGNRSHLVDALVACGHVARLEQGAMASAETESRNQELGSAPSYGGLDLSQEGRISLVTAQCSEEAALPQFAYYTAAVGICDSALEAAGGRDSPNAADSRRVPYLHVEATARSSLATCLLEMGAQQSGLEMSWQAVELRRQVVRTAAPGAEALGAKRMLGGQLYNLGTLLNECGPGNKAGAVACLREALELCEESDDVGLMQAVLGELANLSEQAEATALRARLNHLNVQAGRSPDMNCTVCLEPLEPLDQPGGGDAEEDPTGDYDVAGGSPVHVLGCGHQFHLGCISTWRRTAFGHACPICRK